MNIELEHTGNLTATVKIDITPADYEEKVLKVLKDYQRRAQMPGFRPGKVPFSLAKKMYGPAVTADEVNKLLSESLMKFIEDQKLDILGNPLANAEKTSQVDFNEPKEMSFYFDLGLSPQFEVSLDGNSGVVYHKIEVSDELAEKYLEDMRRRYGNPADVDLSEKDDLLRGDFAELDDHGNVKEEGITSSGSVNPEIFADESIRSLFYGKKVGDVVKFNPLQASGNVADVAAMLGIDKERAENLNAEFNFTITNISRMVLAELNAEFFDTVYPGVEIADKDALIAQIKTDAAGSFVGESDKKFFNEAVKHLIETANIELPDEFMKRWLIDANRDKVSAEEIEHEYDNYARSMRWQLIENKLIREYDLKVDEEEIRDVFRGYFQRPGSLQLDDEMKSRIEGIVDNFMKNNEEVRRIHDQIFDTKIMLLLKEKMAPKEEPVSYDEFVKLVQQQ